VAHFCIYFTLVTAQAITNNGFKMTMFSQWSAISPSILLLPVPLLWQVVALLVPLVEAGALFSWAVPLFARVHTCFLLSHLVFCHLLNIF